MLFNTPYESIKNLFSAKCRPVKMLTQNLDIIDQILMELSYYFYCYHNATCLRYRFLQIKHKKLS